MRNEISAREAAELKKLYRELPPLIWVSANAIKVDETDGVLRGEDLSRYRKLSNELVATMAHIRQITEG